MKRIIIALLLTFNLLACQSDEDEKEGIIPPDKMVGILIDIHLIEAKVSQMKLPLDSAVNYYSFLEKEMYEKYDIDSIKYRASMEYYTFHINELDEIYESVLDSLNIMSAKEGVEAR